MTVGNVAGHVSLVTSQKFYQIFLRTQQFDDFVSGMEPQLKQLCTFQPQNPFWTVVVLRRLPIEDVLRALQAHVSVTFDAQRKEQKPIDFRMPKSSYPFFYRDDEQNVTDWTGALNASNPQELVCEGMTLKECMLLMLACSVAIDCDPKRVFQGKEVLICSGSVYEDGAVPAILLKNNTLHISSYNPNSQNGRGTMNQYVPKIILPKNAVSVL